MAGKRVKCPGCGQAINVPGGEGRAAPAPARPAASPPSPAASSRMDDLFDEEGFSAQVEAVCPACRTEMPGSAVLCTKCGYNKQTGEILESHKTAGVDIDHGTLALQRAANDMEKEKEMQATLLKGGGMPWWALALVLFGLGSALTIAVLVVNASRRVDESVTFNPMGLFLVLMACAFTMLALGSYWMIVVHGFKKEGKPGLLTLIPPYVFYHVYKYPRETWRFLAALLVTGGIAGGLFAAAQSQGGI